MGIPVSSQIDLGALELPGAVRVEPLVVSRNGEVPREVVGRAVAGLDRVTAGASADDGERHLMAPG